MDTFVSFILAKIFTIENLNSKSSSQGLTAHKALIVANEQKECITSDMMEDTYSNAIDLFIVGLILGVVLALIYYKLLTVEKNPGPPMIEEITSTHVDDQIAFHEKEEERMQKEMQARQLAKLERERARRELENTLTKPDSKITPNQGKLLAEIKRVLDEPIEAAKDKEIKNKEHPKARHTCRWIDVQDMLYEIDSMSRKMNKTDIFIFDKTKIKTTMEKDDIVNFLVPVWLPSYFKTALELLSKMVDITQVMVLTINIDIQIVDRSATYKYMNFCFYWNQCSIEGLSELVKINNHTEEQCQEFESEDKYKEISESASVSSDELVDGETVTSLFENLLEAFGSSDIKEEKADLIIEYAFLYHDWNVVDKAWCNKYAPLVALIDRDVAPTRTERKEARTLYRETSKGNDSKQQKDTSSASEQINASVNRGGRSKEKRKSRKKYYTNTNVRELYTEVLLGSKISFTNSIIALKHCELDADDRREVRNLMTTEKYYNSKFKYQKDFWTSVSRGDSESAREILNTRLTKLVSYTNDKQTKLLELDSKLIALRKLLTVHASEWVRDLCADGDVEMNPGPFNKAEFVSKYATHFNETYENYPGPVITFTCNIQDRMLYCDCEILFNITSPKAQSKPVARDWVYNALHNMLTDWSAKKYFETVQEIEYIVNGKESKVVVHKGILNTISPDYDIVNTKKPQNNTDKLGNTSISNAVKEAVAPYLQEIAQYKVRMQEQEKVINDMLVENSTLYSKINKLSEDLESQRISKNIAITELISKMMRRQKDTDITMAKYISDLSNSMNSLNIAFSNLKSVNIIRVDERTRIEDELIKAGVELNPGPFDLYNFIPRYGSYGGPGYSGGHTGGRHFEVEPSDEMDNLFRTHDMDYDTAKTYKDIAIADLKLVSGLVQTVPKTPYGWIYRQFAIPLFTAKAALCNNGICPGPSPSGNESV